MKITADIVNMDHERKPAVVSFRGREYELPSRDAELLNKLIAAEKSIFAAESGREKAEALKQGISAFLGSAAADELYPDIMHADLDEMRRIYNIMVGLAAKRSREIIEEEYLSHD